MGSQPGPSFACLFMGHIEKQIFGQEPNPTYIKDTLTTLSGLFPVTEIRSKNFHPS